MANPTVGTLKSIPLLRKWSSKSSRHPEHLISYSLHTISPTHVPMDSPFESLYLHCSSVRKAPVKLYSSLKTSLNAACLLYEDFVHSSTVAFGTACLIISAFLSSPNRLQNPLRHKLSYFSIYSKPHRHSKTPEIEIQKAYSMCQ